MRARSTVLWLGVLALPACSGPGPGGNGGHVCTFLSSQKGDPCRADYQCPDGHRAASCLGTDCVCLSGTNDTPGSHFPAAGFCAASTTAQQSAFEANCLGGGGSDAGASDGGCKAQGAACNGNNAECCSGTCQQGICAP